MKLSKSLLALASACCLHVHAQESMTPQAFEAWKQSAQPVAQHEQLARWVGEWTTVQRDWVAPGKPWNETQGQATYRPLLDGRFIELIYSATLMQQPYHGRGLFGYHRESKKFVGTWIDDFGTSILPMTGDMDASGNTLTLKSAPGPMGVWTMTSTWIDPKHHHVEWWGPGPDGKPMKTVEIDYSRR